MPESLSGLTVVEVVGFSAFVDGDAAQTLDPHVAYVAV